MVVDWLIEETLVGIAATGALAEPAATAPQAATALTEGH